MTAFFIHPKTTGGAESILRS